MSVFSVRHGRERAVSVLNCDNEILLQEGIGLAIADSGNRLGSSIYDPRYEVHKVADFAKQAATLVALLIPVSRGKPACGYPIGNDHRASLARDRKSVV